MTVHDWIKSLEFGRPVKIPQNVSVRDIIEYGVTRFGYAFRVDKVNNTIVRFCPTCKR